MHMGVFSLFVSQEYLRAALMASLLSVWVLVGLFFYLNRFTRREYFTVWTAAWLFYALWLTMCLTSPSPSLGSLIFTVKQWCISFSAVFLLWGSLSFLQLPIRQTLFGLFMVFLVVWTSISPALLASPVQAEIPVFLLLGSGSWFAAGCFYRLRRKIPYVGAGMLSLGFLLWGIYLATYPWSLLDDNLRCAGFFGAAVVQLLIAVSMIVLVLEEVRHKSEQLRLEMEAARSERQILQGKVLSAEEECRSLYDRVRLTEGVQKAYDELRRTQATVVQQERLRALGQMASGVAHDVNNALSPISAYAELLLHTIPELPEDAERYLKTILRCGQDIAHIVARLREFYRPQEGTARLTKLNVNEIMDQTIELTRPRWRDIPQKQGITIQIRSELDAGLPPLLCDPTDLREALTNLIFNAVDALPSGGTISLTSKLVKAPEQESSGAGCLGILIQVRDDGLGMDETTRQRCLEPFYSTKFQGGGTGLGLAMVYGMMRRHEGSIEIESAPGTGTCMSLFFPFRKPGAGVSKSAGLADSQTLPRSLNLLCVDDEPELRNLLKECLGVFNHQVTVASCADEALELFQNALRDSDPFTAVITDLGMPQMDGNQFAQRVKAQSPGTPVIMLTGWGNTTEEEREQAGKVDALIGKPVCMEELNTLLLRLCA